ncbi:23S rRNA (uracil(747)-C(5))-methyltransferase RlmC [uncultured Thiothrix sp.]|uniref:23S rRNA (uracil(747)-C(5))-methyltransferase RlmC n=1 Tax=uncultured Thiothrix sp. TaxID=223185 RepID=UPI002627D8A3|nr:23S rRNA (uracil(747)-C(5))-methyltransferase RlmC [uncultured Thiothrix sp.]HMT94879.1 23S rRNA (uracil(747)-C(5))-methyltransferase RlmC [Thiolinea sp.]
MPVLEKITTGWQDFRSKMQLFADPSITTMPSSLAIPCPHFAAQHCTSCRWLDRTYVQQLAAKQLALKSLLADFVVHEWCEPVPSPLQGFRNKAKMVVLGAAHAPILGIMGAEGKPLSLTDCPLYPVPMQALLQRLEGWIQQAGLPPYRLDKQKGELKYILLTHSRLHDQYLLRFVLRSEQAIPRIQANLPLLLADFPNITVISANIQPVHMAILEGKQEIFLSAAKHLPEQFNDVPLSIRPKSFFQTNPIVAAKLYQTAREWTQALQPTVIWDLFCGVGGFGLHCASTDTQLTGIEIEAEAIACARNSAQALHLKHVNFLALDSNQFQPNAEHKPELVIVNPPRRGLGMELVTQLATLNPAAILYSSCNALTLAQDLPQLKNYQIKRVQLFDMFAHTEHFETLVLLTHYSSPPHKE